jgi:hypothetical protein
MTRRIDCSDYDVLYSKLLRLFRIDYMFTVYVSELYGVLNS